MQDLLLANHFHLITTAPKHPTPRGDLIETDWILVLLSKAYLDGIEMICRRRDDT